MLERWLELRKYLLYNSLLAWRTKDFWLRALACWLIGAVLLSSDEAANYDLRLKARGAKPATTRLLIVDLNERDWIAPESGIQNVLRPLKEVVSFNDAYFWNPQAWEKMFARLLAAEPRAIGVTFFFGENVRSNRISPAARALFEDPRVVWGADIDNNGRLLVPLFASTYNSNVGLRSLRADDDGVIRRFSNSNIQVPHLAARLSEVAAGKASSIGESQPSKTLVINFAGDRQSFEVVSAKEVLEGRVDPNRLRGRIVLIGSLAGEILQTPLGRMSLTEIVANMTDTLIADKAIRRLPISVYLVLLAILMIGSIWVLVTYPQSVTLVVFGLAAIVWTAVSTWAFDSWFAWIPILSPLAQLTVTCIVFLSYQLAINERRTWSLEQEQRYLSEIEQLKSNFVSMMSHDLKTPIAKIQAICDRLIAATPESPIAQDLKSLRRSSDELHRYIQSILQVTKVEAKDFRIQKEVTDINENIERVLARLRPLAREKGIEIETSLEPMFSIEVDTTLIQEVIHNLVENAIKYTSVTENRPGRAGVVRVVSKEKDDKVEVVIEDTGPGIDPEDQKNIWRKFTRGRIQTSGGSEVKGTGLGLYLVKYFIELHGGQVFLESVLGKGTRIGFAIPIAEPEAEMKGKI